MTAASATHQSSDCAPESKGVEEMRRCALADALEPRILGALRDGEAADGELRPRSQEADLDGIVDYLRRNAHDPEAVRRVAGALRHTVETSLWQSIRHEGGTLPLIHAEVFGKATGLYLEKRLRSLVHTARRWLVMLSSPRRFLWAVQAAWRGDDLAEFVQTRDEWHTVDEIVIFGRDPKIPLVRVGDPEGPPRDDFLSANPLFGVVTRYLSRDSGHEDDLPAAETAIASQSMVVVGALCETTARVTGHPPANFRADLQRMCDAADAVLADKEIGKSELAFRLKQLATPLLRKRGPFIAEQFWNPITLLAVCLTTAAAVLGSAGVEHLRWEKMVKELDMEPGIEVIAHSSAWGHREIEMLRDPLARAPAEVMLDLGWNPASVSIRERPFVSAEEPLFAARQQSQLGFAKQITDETRESHEDMRKLADQTSAALAKVRGNDAESPATPAAIREQVLSSVRVDLVRSLMNMPPELELSLRDDILVAKGTLTEPAFTRLANARKFLAWLKGVDLDGVHDLTGENIAKLAADLEKVRVDFVPVSAILPEASKLRLQSVASDLNLLASELRLKRETTRVRFCAVHPTVDATMTAQRIETVRQEIERQNVPAEWFETDGQFLDAPGPHSIAFKIVIEPNPSEP